MRGQGGSIAMPFHDHHTPCHRSRRSTSFGLASRSRILVPSILVLSFCPSFADEPGGILPKPDEPLSLGAEAWRSFERWQSVANATLDPNARRQLVFEDGAGVIVNGNRRAPNIITRADYGDVQLHIEFLVPEGSNSGVYLMGRYEVQILDSHGKEKPTYDDCGGIYQRWDPKRGQGKEGYDGRPPRVNAARRPGEWQTYDVIFRAPRFDENGKRTEKARFVKVIHNGIVIHENVELSGPTRAATWEREEDEKPSGPLMLQGDHGPVAFRSIRIWPLAGDNPGGAEILRRETFDDSGFVSIFDGTTLAGWHVSSKTGHSGASGHTSGGRWIVEDGAITGSQDIPGNGGIILSDRTYGDFEVIVEMRNDYGPDSGLFLRSTENGAAYQYMVDYHDNGNLAGIYGEGLPGGIHQRNFDITDDVTRIVAQPAPYPLPIRPEDWPRLWKHGEWNELRARIIGNPPRITTWINGVRITEFEDKEKRHVDKGSIALQVHGGGDFTKQFVRYRGIRVKELGAGAK
jgi:hypothetical protein